MDTQPTNELLNLAGAGDMASWDALVARYSRLVWSVVRGFRLSDADAADVSQTTWLRLVENLNTIKDPDHLAGWLTTTAKREALKVLRQAGREIPAFDGVDESAGSQADRWAPDPETVVIADDEYRRLWRAFAGLSESCRSLLWLVTAAPVGSYAEVSAALGMPIGSVGPTRARCLERLRVGLMMRTETGEIAAGVLVEVTGASPRAEAGRRRRRPPQAGVAFRIGFDLDARADRPWAWPRDRDSGDMLAVRVLLIADGAGVRPPALICRPEDDAATFEITPAATGPVRIRVLVYYDAGSVFLSELTGVVYQVAPGAMAVTMAGIG